MENSRPRKGGVRREVATVRKRRREKGGGGTGKGASYP